ncbi:hypothetical protein D3C71_1831390 [compost metagenome]
MPSNVYTAVLAARIEYSSVNTTSSGISQYWPTKARLVEPSGTTLGRSLFNLGMNCEVI